MGSWRKVQMNIVKGFLTLDFCQFAEQYFITRFSSGKDIMYGDRQAHRSMSIYGDAFTDTILKLSTDHVSTLVQKTLLPTYTYVRFYQKGDELEMHTDRSECEYSATLCLSTPTDQPLSSLYFNDKPTKSGADKITLNRGDLCVYQGCDYYHWREPIESDWLLQCFMHWVDASGPNKDLLFDGRPSLGLPK
jgi:hypothetical protein